ncbi:hypothetical protein FA95DRAFT_1344827 [Auriscalpium vulgare]|uniref:Uncharacterized protein n=1 Tax=Auriscalpium vulgare TaxID=40419 RepID=A0ACB8R1B2_9AGAM|nr:hypothetical protein FA95DRAFT_1344827 [Auriscalpium vulgare]
MLHVCCMCRNNDFSQASPWTTLLRRTFRSAAPCRHRCRRNPSRNRGLASPQPSLRDPYKPQQREGHDTTPTLPPPREYRHMSSTPLLPLPLLATLRRVGHQRFCHPACYAVIFAADYVERHVRGGNRQARCVRTAFTAIRPAQAYASTPYVTSDILPISSPTSTWTGLCLRGPQVLLLIRIMRTSNTPRITPSFIALILRVLFRWHHPSRSCSSGFYWSSGGSRRFSS